ncbi:MAG: DNA recombination protein RmuC, partial [Bacteroidales bacterium]|nr:DNA recombination protein RmuC [Bacteroidales bacterium]
MIILYSGIALIIGVFVTWLIGRTVSGKKVAFLKEQLAESDKEKGILNERLMQARSEILKLEKSLEDERSARSELVAGHARQAGEIDNLREKLTSQKSELEELQKKFATEFENIANRLLRENSREFTNLNQKNIGDILLPLREKIEKFEKKVDDTYQKGLVEQTQLKDAIENLHKLNVRISEEANNLTRALKSDSKKMGNWGELILDRILEQSGLEKGKEYYTQYTDRSEEGTVLRPDVVIALP